MKLYHHDRLLGEISGPGVDGRWMVGGIALLPDAEPYLSFFEFMTNEDQGWIDPPFSEDLLDEENWFVEENGQMQGISVPAIHSDGTIYWRWR